MDGASKCSPAAAVPVRTNMPDPMMAPIPRAVRLHGPRLFFSRCSGSSESEISLSIDLQANSWLPEGFGLLSVVACAKSGPAHVGFVQVFVAHWQGGALANTNTRRTSQSNRVFQVLLETKRYRLLVPRTIFFTLRFAEPRGVVRLPSGLVLSAFLRAVRLAFLRSTLSVIVLVFIFLRFLHLSHGAPAAPCGMRNGLKPLRSLFT